MSKPILSVTMAAFRDYYGVWPTVVDLHRERLRLGAVADVEIVVRDTDPKGSHAKATRELVSSLPNAVYAPANIPQGSALAKEHAIRTARGEYKLLIDSHVMLADGVLKRALQFWQDNPRDDNLHQGPNLHARQVYDDGRPAICGTHFKPVWGTDGMYGTWAIDERAYDPSAEPFEIELGGTGLFMFRAETWPGFDTQSRGFGAEEGPLHEQYRVLGRKCLCHPWLQWIHRYAQKGVGYEGPQYDTSWYNRGRNYLLSFKRFGYPDFAGIKAAHVCVDPRTGQDRVTPKEWDQLMEELQIDPNRPRELDRIRAAKSKPATVPSSFTAMTARLAQSAPPALTPSAPVKVATVVDAAPDCPHRFRKAGTVLCNTGCPAMGSEPVDVYDCTLYGLVTLTHRRRDLKNCNRCMAVGENIMPAPASVQPPSTPSPSIAVVIISHNYGHFLAAAIESVLSQSLAPREIVVIDDASRDTTRDVTKQYAARGVAYRRIEALSPNLARKTGMEATSADAIVYLDADDTLPPDYLRECQSCLVRTGADVIYTAAWEFDDGDAKWNPEPGNLQQKNFVHAGAMVTRNALERCQVFATPNEFPHEDWEMWRRIQRRGGRFERCDSTHYNYRKHSESRSQLRPGQSELGHAVLGCYLSGTDPQRNEPVPADDPSRIKEWAESAKRAGCSAILLVDAPVPRISAEFPWVKLMQTESTPGPTHAIAWRWQCIVEFLSRFGSAYRSIFCTDVFDVSFRIDPNEMVSRSHQLYLGREVETIGSNTPSAEWLTTRFENTHGYLPKELHGRPMLNAGIVGGWTDAVRDLAREMWDYLSTKGPVHSQASDMVAINLIGHLHRPSAKVWHNGEPLHSRFKGFETSRDDVCIIHK